VTVLPEHMQLPKCPNCESRRLVWLSEFWQECADCRHVLVDEPAPRSHDVRRRILANLPADPDQAQTAKEIADGMGDVTPQQVSAHLKAMRGTQLYGAWGEVAGRPRRYYAVR
jgi:hypothetical protein